MKYLLFPVSILIFLPSCRSTDQWSKPQHQAAQPTPMRGAWGWVEVDDELVKRQTALKGTTLYPPDQSPSKEITQRLQFWVDEIHSRLNALYPEWVEKAPRPLVRLYQDESYNGFVSSYPFCFPAKLRQMSALPADTAYATKDFPEELQEATWGDCIRHPSLADQVEPMVEVFNRAMSPSCHIQRADGELFLPEECKLPDSDFSDLAIPLTVNRLFLSTGMVKAAASEEEVVSVIAHELGHYYRMHSSLANPFRYNYFYQRSSKEAMGRPKEALEMRSLSEQVNSLAFTMWPFLQRLPQQKMHPQVSVAYAANFGEQLNEFCAHTAAKCSAACLSYRELYEGTPEGENAVQVLFKAKATGQEQNLYFRWEKAFLQCAETVKITSAGDDPSRLQIHTPETIDEIPETLAELLPLFDRYFKEQENAFYALAQQVQASQIGFYTDEEEADDMGAELLALLGIDPSIQVDRELARLKNLEQQQDNHKDNIIGNLSYATCKMLRENNWKVADDQLIYIHMGATYSDHHSTCYRAFNVAQEIVSHQYVLGRLPLLPPGPDFSTLQRRLSEQK